MSNDLTMSLSRLSARSGFCYTTGSNSVLVPGLETAKFTFGSTVRLCAAIHHCGALLRHASEQALSGASIQAGLKGCAAFLFRASGVSPVQLARERVEVAHGRQMPALRNGIRG